MSAVNSPDHYTQGRMEAIYVIEQVLGKEGFKAFCMGNYLKYHMRAVHKNGKEDLEKAEVYLEWATNGLPEPVNGFLPKKQEGVRTPLVDSTGTLINVLQNLLDKLVPDYFKVDKVTTFHRPNNSTDIRAEVLIKETEINLSPIKTCPIVYGAMQGSRHSEIAELLVDQIKLACPEAFQNK